MAKINRVLITVAAMLLLVSCDQRTENAEPEQMAEEGAPQNVVDLTIDGLSFVGPHEIGSGWVTVRIHNDSGMTHFGLVERLPDGKTERDLSVEIIDRFQAALTATLEGDVETAAAISQEVPAWIGEIVFLGGPGATGDEQVSEATMYLEPGTYSIECYVKTNGMQHNYNPDPDKPGMVHELTVTETPGGMSEPEANVTLEIRNSGYTIAEGQFVAGHNSVRVRFVEQRLYNNFVGHDAHFFRIDPDTDVEAAAQWIDFFPVDGQQSPAPAHFVGGIHDMPQGSTAYFGVELEPGDYGIVAEVPNAKEQGLFTRFSVPE